MRGIKIMDKMVQASLLSDINITPLILEEDMIQLEFKSETQPDEKYLVSMNEYGDWKCDCPNYIYHVGDECSSYLCKHILKAITYLNEHREKLQKLKHVDDAEVEGLNGC